MNYKIEKVQCLHSDVYRVDLTIDGRESFEVIPLPSLELLLSDETRLKPSVMAYYEVVKAAIDDFRNPPAAEVSPDFTTKKRGKKDAKEDSTG